jgi:hypothetical protein
MYKCTCPDYAVRYNMCKHIHAVCKVQKESNIGVQAEHTSDNLVVDEWREIEANVHVEQLPTFSRSSSSKSGNKEESRALLSELALHLNDEEGNEEEEAAVIVEGLRIIKAKLAAIQARKSLVGANSLDALNRPIQKEPSNKSIQKQMRFVTIKKPRQAHRLSLAKPTSVERRDIGLSLIRPRLEVWSCDANTRSDESDAVGNMQEEAVEWGYEKKGAECSNQEVSSKRGENEEAAVQMGVGVSEGEGGRRVGQSECMTTSTIDNVSASPL